MYYKINNWMYIKILYYENKIMYHKVKNYTIKYNTVYNRLKYLYNKLLYYALL